MTAEPRRIVHISTERSYRGGERQVALLAHGLVNETFTQLVAAPARSRLTSAARRIGIDVTPLSSRPYRPINLLRLTRAARLAPARTVLHTHTSPALSLARLVRRWTPGVRILHTRRVAFPVRPASKYRTGADRYVAISEAIARQLASGGVEPDRLDVIHSGIDLTALDRPHLGSIREGLEPGSAVVVCVGSITAEKGHAVLLEAWDNVIRHRPDAVLVVIGEGPLRSTLQPDAGPSVRFLGQRDDVVAWLHGADLYVQPSLAEGLGTATLEAMGCSLAVVASAVGGLPEAVDDGVTGVLIPPADAGALATAVVGLLSDPARRAAMGAEGRRRVERLFQAARMVHRYVEVYRRVLG